MPPTIHLVRHAQGHHVGLLRIVLHSPEDKTDHEDQNVAKYGESIHDPFLTEDGENQCRELCRNFKHHDKVRFFAE